jgi:O-antigen ligase
MNARQFIYLLFIAELILSGFWYAGSALTAMFLMVAGVVGCRSVFVQQSWQVYTLSKLMLLYLLWLFVVAWMSAVPETAMMTLATLAGLPIMYLFATNSQTFSHIWKYLRVALFIMAVVLALWAIWQVSNHVGYGHARGPFQDRNLFAALMNLLWFPAAFLFLTFINSRFHYKLFAIGAGLFFISMGLFATTSRGGIATWLLLLPVFLWAAYRYHQSTKRIVYLVLIAVLAYLCSALLLNASFADRTFQLTQDPSTNARLLLWKSSLQMLLAHPVVGSGWGTFVHYYPAYRVPQESTTAGFFAHNDYLQLALEGGIPALLLHLGVLAGLLTQIRRSLRQKASNAVFERVALLLAVMALFIHALLNFIFYQALMNILAGLYLARAAQLSDKADTLAIFGFNKINPFIKYLFAGTLLALITLPYSAHLLGLSINNQAYVKTENLLSDKFSAYKLAEWITLIQPQERFSQETVLQTAELALGDSAFISNMGEDFYRRLLNSALQRYDSLRALNANDAGIGVRQANILIQHQAAFENDFAYAKAYQILDESLQANPYHVESIITLSRLQLKEGRSDDALQTMKHARAKVFMRRDRQLIFIELLRQLAAPKFIPELDTLAKELRSLRLGSETGKQLILPEHYFEDVDSKLSAIAYQIKHQTP